MIMTTTYRWIDFWTKERNKTRCEIVSRTRATATIRLLEFGPKGHKPGDLMKVQTKNLDLPIDRPVQMELDWHRWTD